MNNCKLNMYIAHLKLLKETKKGLPLPVNGINRVECLKHTQNSFPWVISFASQVLVVRQQNLSIVIKQNN